VGIMGAGAGWALGAGRREAGGRGWDLGGGGGGRRICEGRLESGTGFLGHLLGRDVSNRRAKQAEELGIVGWVNLLCKHGLDELGKQDPLHPPAPDA
jgi:hypothetical protein